MSDIKKPSLKFANLHNHDTFSIFDGMGFPEDHIDYAYSNGLEGIAFTNHGNCNSLSYAYQKDKKMKAEGKEFKVAYGIEAYINPSIPNWKLEKEKHKEDSKLSKQIDDDVGLVVENEAESKKSIRSTLNQRSHLVMVAQNQKGLNNMFKLVSDSYGDDNFYRFPRMDYEMLKKHNEGIIVSSACIGGILGQDYWANIDKGEAAVCSAMEKTVKVFMDIYGDRFYGELQWAMHKEQHIINQMIIKLSKQFGFKLITTCDAHYPSPDLWKDREIYKMLGWLNKSKDQMTIDQLPSSLDEMAYQLYPKNGDELFSYYKKTSEKLGFSYEDDLVAESIERTSDIFKNRIENYSPNADIKLPSFVVPDGQTADETLVKLSIESLKKAGLHKDSQYVDRLKEELHTIKDRGFSKYFLTMKKIANKSKDHQICGGGRGSGAGSLVSYLLDITEVDPIKYKLQFSRFIRKGDCIGEVIENEVESDTKIQQVIKITSGGKELLFTPESSIKILRNSSTITVTAKTLIAGDEIITF